MTKHLILVSFLAACGASSTPAASTTPTAAATKGIHIKHTSVFVDDQEKCLRFYTEVLGLTKKDDFSNEGYRWLTVTSPADPNGTELQLAKNDNPAGKAYQESLYTAKQPALMLYSDDVKGDFERMKGKGATFTQPPTEVTMSIIATVDDGCGNLVQLTQLER